MTDKKRAATRRPERQRILAIVKKTQMHAHLATTDGRQPHVRSVSPIVDKELGIWIATFARSRKVKHIRRNPRVCLQFVSQPRGEQAVVVLGSALVVRDRIEKQRVWKLAPYDLAEYFADGPASKDYCLLRIKPARIEWRESWTGGMHVWR